MMTQARKGESPMKTLYVLHTHDGNNGLSIALGKKLLFSSDNVSISGKKEDNLHIISQILLGVENTLREKRQEFRKKIIYLDSHAWIDMRQTMKEWVLSELEERGTKPFDSFI